jgi:hypothetical protein
MTVADHPIPQKTISRTLEYSDQVGAEFGDAPHEAVWRYSTMLTEVQATLQENLRTIVGGAYSGTATTGITIVCESPGYYIFGDADQILRDALAADCGFEAAMSLIVVMHHRTASQCLNEYPDTELNTEYAWIVRKRPGWYDAQWAVDKLFTHLLGRGLSPTQAVDYWMVSVLDKRPVEWAKIRGTSGQAIRNSVRTAEENLATTTDSQTESTYTPLQRTYRGHTDTEETEVTVDGHFLYPRVDIAEYAASRKLTWGYRGGGSYQLAVALLADALGTDEIPFAALDEFVGFLNSELADEWTLTAERIQAWVYHNTDFFD